jgi:branched-chain amino acid transport system permease protein
MTPVSFAARTRRFNSADVLLVVAWIATWTFGQLYLALATAVLIMVIFGLSLDLAQGYGGIETLGHSAFFGVGAYGAGLYATYGSTEPLTGLGVGALAAAAFALVSGIAVIRVRGLTQIMLTMACATLLMEAANAAKSITGGDDGLSGYSIAAIFGQFEFDILGRTAFLYSSAVLLAVFLLCKHLVRSPFGLTAQGIRENLTRMQLLGVNTSRRLLFLYCISGALAGLAGALSAQVNKIVGIDALAFTLSANVVILLALGGPGRLYGAFFGAILFVLMSDRAAAIDPTNWLAALGVLLILVMRFAPDGIAGLAQRLSEKAWSRGPKPPVETAQPYRKEST